MPGRGGSRCVVSLSAPITLLRRSSAHSLTQQCVDCNLALIFPPPLPFLPSPCVLIRARVCFITTVWWSQNCADGLRREALYRTSAHIDLRSILERRIAPPDDLFARVQVR